jgi:hypothetical protein
MVRVVFETDSDLVHLNTDMGIGWIDAWQRGQDVGTTTPNYLGNVCELQKAHYKSRRKITHPDEQSQECALL